MLFRKPRKIDSATPTSAKGVVESVKRSSPHTPHKSVTTAEKAVVITMRFQVWGRVEPFTISVMRSHFFGTPTITSPPGQAT